MNLKDLQLGIENIAGRKDRIQILSAEERYSRDADGKRESTLEGYNFYITSLGGSLQPIKLPLSAKKTYAEAKQALDIGDIVFIGDFRNFKAIAYAISDGNRIRSGVSCSAEDIELKIIHVNEDDSLIDL